MAFLAETRFKTPYSVTLLNQRTAAKDLRKLLRAKTSMFYNGSEALVTQ